MLDLLAGEIQRVAFNAVHRAVRAEMDGERAVFFHFAAARHFVNIIPAVSAEAGAQQGRADFTLHDSLSMLDYLKRTPDSGLKVAWQAPRAEWEPSGLIVAKENEAAIAPIDAALKALQADGTLKRLSEQFFGADVSVRDAR